VALGCQALRTTIAVEINERTEKSDLGPDQAGDLVSTLSGQHQQPNGKRLLRRVWTGHINWSQFADE
jgi:hypothetical protein